MANIQIQRQSSNELILYKPAERFDPMTIVALVFIVLIVSLCVRSTRGWKKIPPILLGAFFVWLIVPQKLEDAALSRKLEASRSSRKMQVTDSWFGSSRNVWTIPLDQVSYAVVQKSDSPRLGSGSRLVLVLKLDREVAPFGTAYTDLGGLTEARDAINQFLGVHLEN